MMTDTYDDPVIEQLQDVLAAQEGLFTQAVAQRCQWLYYSTIFVDETILLFLFRPGEQVVLHLFQEIDPQPFSRHCQKEAQGDLR